jgi:transketolase
LSFTEDAGARFGAYGWQVLRVEDGNDVPAHTPENGFLQTGFINNRPNS